MKRRFYFYLTIGLLVVILASCSSVKSLKKSHSIEGISKTEYLEKVLSKSGAWEALTAKMALSVDLEGKGATKVSGTLRIKKDEVIQLSVAPYLGIEVGRMEISPQGLLIIDRINKRYVSVPFAEVKSLANVDLDFNTLQSLFLNELFYPGEENLTLRDASRFQVELEEDGLVLEARRTKRLGYQFLVQGTEALLKESSITLKGTPYGLKWKYADFRLLDAKPFPTDIQVMFEGGKKPVKAAFALSRLSTDSDWEAHTEISKRYKKVKLEDILKQLLKK